MDGAEGQQLTMSSCVRAPRWLVCRTLLLLLLMLMAFLNGVVEETESTVAAAGLVALRYRLANAHAHSQEVGLGVGGQDGPEYDGGLLLRGGAWGGFVEERGNLTLGRIGGGTGERTLGAMGGHDAGAARSETCMS